MNIGIDHGYYAIKTRHFSFPAGISEYSYKLIFPAMMICLITLACNLLGDGLRDAFDPKLRR